MTYLGKPDLPLETIFWNTSSYISGAHMSANTPTYVQDNPGTWTTIYEVDFTTLTTASLTANGPISFNGVSWDRNNTVNASWIALSGATAGLELRANSNSSDFWQVTRTAPIVCLPFKNIPTLSSSYFDANLYDLRIVYQMSGVNAGAASETSLAVIEKSSSLPTQNWMACMNRSYTHEIIMEKCFNAGTPTGVNPDGVVTSTRTKVGGVILFNDLYGIQTQWFHVPSISGTFDLNAIQPATSINHEWTTYTFANGIAPFVSDYRDYNFLCSVKTANTNKTAVARLFRFYFQVKPKRTAIPSKYNMRYVTSSYSMINTDGLMYVSASTAITMSLPTMPFNGQTHVIKAFTNNPPTNNIVVSSSTNTLIENSSTYKITSSYGSVNLTYLSSSNLNVWGIV